MNSAGLKLEPAVAQRRNAAERLFESFHLEQDRHVSPERRLSLFDICLLVIDKSQYVQRCHLAFEQRFDFAAGRRDYATVNNIMKPMCYGDFMALPHRQAGVAGMSRGLARMAILRFGIPLQGQRPRDRARKRGLVWPCKRHHRGRAPRGRQQSQVENRNLGHPFGEDRGFEFKGRQG